MSAAAVQDLRRVVAAVARLRGETIHDLVVRSDVRQLRVELASGLILVIAAERDPQGRPRLEVDVVEAPATPAGRAQMEVRFD